MNHRLNLGFVCLVAAAAVAGLASAPARADVVVTPYSVVSDKGDGPVSNGTQVFRNLATERVGLGGSGSDVRGFAVLYFFELPTISSPADLASADLSVFYSYKSNNPAFSIDVYGAGTTSASPIDGTVIVGVGYSDGPSATGTLIQSSLVAPTTTANQAIDLSTGGQASLLDVLKSVYNPDGTPTATFLVIRLNASTTLQSTGGASSLVGYNFNMADATSNRPTLSFTTVVTAVPTPAALSGGLVLLGAAALRRRRR